MTSRGTVETEEGRAARETLWSRYRATWATLDSIRVPAPTRVLAILVVLLAVAGAAALWFTPWVQTVSGRGEVTALDPRDRQQDINALVGGRIDEWFVRDGSTVAAGDPIVRLVDNDPQLLERLRDERAAVERRVEAIRLQVETAEYDYERQQTLHEDGLASRLDMEEARIQLEELRSQLADARARLQQAEVRLSRESMQTVRAPRAGTILDLAAGGTATRIRQGERVARFVPADVERAVQLYLDGRDAALVEPGRKVRLQFEGWPAVQFGGWPSVAVGTFGGEVAVVDRSANRAGRFRVMVVPDPDAPAWPEERFVRLGTQARGWVLLDTVRLGYELWRQLNNFPPDFQVPGSGAAGSAASGGSGGSGS